jgi:hypothetical protein
MTCKMCPHLNKRTCTILKKGVRTTEQFNWCSVRNRYEANKIIQSEKEND